jgi:hypothetical protein
MIKRKKMEEVNKDKEKEGGRKERRTSRTC